MEQIFPFESHTPPPLTEKLLREELERRKLQRQALLLTLAAVLTQACLVTLGLCLYPSQPTLAFVCLAYTCLSVTASGLLALVYTRKRSPVNKSQVSK